MNATEIAAYKAETARVKAQEADRPQQDADRLAAHEVATQAALKTIRDADHENALAEDRERSYFAGFTIRDLRSMRANAATDSYRDGCTMAINRRIERDHSEALVEYRKVLAGRRLDRACEICSDDQRARHTNRDHDQAVTADHENGLLANLPCELCGRVEAHINHRGTGHTHTPAVTPEGRASALVAYGSRGNDVPEYVFTTALMMVSSSNPGDIVMIDQTEAEADEVDRKVVTELQSTGAWTATWSAWTTTRELAHPAEPHSRRPNECRSCGQPIHNRFDEGGNLVSSAHYA